MKWCGLLVVLWMLAWPAGAQRLSLDKQCSKAREIAWQALHRQFADIIDSEIRHSNGYSTDGRWTFSTTRYATSLLWSGALACSIEHYLDERDSLQIESWQYLADFGVMPDEASARQMAEALRMQVEGCVMPVLDSAAILLQPAVAEELPLTIPEPLQEAWVFTLPAEQEGDSEVFLMVALEKTKRGLRPLLIMECYTERSKYPGQPVK